MPLTTAPPVVAVKPTREVRTVAPVNEVAVEGGRAATLVGDPRGWEYLLVWSPKGVVVRASIACDTQESNVVLSGNRFAHVCFQSENIVVTGTVSPLRARVALRAPGSEQVALAGRGGLIAGTAGKALFRFDRTRRVRLRSFARPAIALGVDEGRILVDRDTQHLDVVSQTGRLEYTVNRAHEGGARMRAGRIATISGRTLVITDLHGGRVLTRKVARGARLEDFGGAYAVCTVETRLHVVRISDAREVVLRLRGQFGYAHAQLAGQALFYSYNQRSGKVGHAGFLAHVSDLFRR